MPTQMDYPEKALIIMTHSRAGQQGFEKSLNAIGLGHPTAFMPTRQKFSTMGSYHALAFKTGVKNGILGMTMYMENLLYLCNCPRWAGYTPERWLTIFLRDLAIPVSYIYYHNDNQVEIVDRAMSKMHEMRWIDYFRSESLCPLYVNPAIQDDVVKHIKGWFQWQG